MRYLHLCAHEQFPPEQLLRQAVAAEAAGFAGIGCSDHLQPWWEPGESGHAWVWLGAAAQNRAWGIGSKESNDGALLIIAPKERKVRVEVGYGLEPVLTDALSSVIIQTQILPEFRQGNMAAGIIAGTTAIVSQLRLPEDQARANAAEAAKRPRDQSGSIAPLIVWLVIMGFLVLPLFRRRRFGRSGPVVLWGPGFGGGSSGGGSFGGFGGGGGGFSGGGGSFGGGGASGGW